MRICQQCQWCKMFIITVASTVFLCFVNINGGIAEENAPIVTLPDGPIQGHALQTANENTYYAFQQIPYASPPIGSLRFKEAVPPTKWTEVLNTTHNSKVCYQIGNQNMIPNVTQTEDCLYINVYTPLNPEGDLEKPLPVYVWIHGGGFIYGYGIYQELGPQFLIDYNVVVVTFNYRLGPLGFLTTEDGVIPGNLALKDQNFALQWVNENIHLFGGDTSKITIAGESAGGASIGFQLISKKSAGLYRAAILQSGTAISPFAYQPHARYYAFQVAQLLNPEFNSEDSAELLEYLQTVPVESIINADLTIPPEYVTSGSDLIWTPIIEDENLEGAFITGPMHEDIKNGNINQVPIIIGFNSEESVVMLMPDLEANSKAKANKLDNDLKELVMIYDVSEDEEVPFAEELRKIYTDTTFEDQLSSVIRFTSDETFTTPASRHADLQSNYTDVYLYQFSHKGPLGGTNVNITIEGIDSVGHAEDLKYIWSTENNTDITKFPVEDQIAHHRILTLWTNFVKYLNPTPDKNDLLQNIIWPKVTPGNLTYLNLNTTMELTEGPKQYKEWKNVIEKYTKDPLIVY